MRWLIINTTYGDFLRWLYAQQPGLESGRYQEQWQACMNSLFGVADFYSAGLRALGEDACDLIANNVPMQMQWAREHRLPCGRKRYWRLRRRRGLPWPHQPDDKERLYDILAAQIRDYRPDIIYCMAIEFVGTAFLRRVQGLYRLAVAQHAAMVPGHQEYRGYDLILSSLPNLVENFRHHAVASELFRLGFGERILQHLNGIPRSQDVVFVGGLSGVQHDAGARLLERVCRRHNMSVWGYGLEGLPPDSPLRARYRGPVWGRAMYETLRSAKIVLNRHGPIAGPYANNMRLYEATGVGSLLLTDDKQNLAEVFAPGREVVTFRDADECADLAGYYLAHDAEREAIAQAGQARTLREHTYTHRMAELVQIVRRHL